MKKLQQGFTLIELMIVVAIIGILAAIAIPQYQDYVASSQVTGCLSEVRGGKTQYETYVNRGIVTGDAQAAALYDTNGLGLQASVCDPTVNDNGFLINEPATDGSAAPAIQGTIKGSPAVNGETIQLNRMTDGSWHCQVSGGMAQKYWPEGCDQNAS